MPTRDRTPESYLPLRSTHFHVLLTLAGGPTHGYGIRRAVDERTDGRILLAAGTLYDTLQRLESNELIVETERPADAEDASSRWRFYALTALGREVAHAELTRLEADVAAARSELAPQG